MLGFGKMFSNDFRCSAQPCLISPLYPSFHPPFHTLTSYPFLPPLPPSPPSHHHLINAPDAILAVVTTTLQTSLNVISTNGILCKTFVDRGKELNVSFLMTPDNQKAAGAICPVPTAVCGYTDELCPGSPTLSPLSSPAGRYRL